jgi:hypothetical protein
MTSFIRYDMRYVDVKKIFTCLIVRSAWAFTGWSSKWVVFTLNGVSDASAWRLLLQSCISHLHDSPVFWAPVGSPHDFQ